jgi:hypothetical protein
MTPSDHQNREVLIAQVLRYTTAPPRERASGDALPSDMLNAKTSVQQSTAAQASLHISTTPWLLKSTGCLTEAWLHTFLINNLKIPRPTAEEVEVSLQRPSAAILAANRSPLGTFVLLSQPNCTHAPFLTLLRASSLLSLFEKPRTKHRAFRLSLRSAAPRQTRPFGQPSPFSSFF